MHFLSHSARGWQAQVDLSLQASPVNHRARARLDATGNLMSNRKTEARYEDRYCLITTRFAYYKVVRAKFMRRARSFPQG